MKRKYRVAAVTHFHCEMPRRENDFTALRRHRGHMNIDEIYYEENEDFMAHPEAGDIERQPPKYVEISSTCHDINNIMLTSGRGRCWPSYSCHHSAENVMAKAFILLNINEYHQRAKYRSRCILICINGLGENVSTRKTQN